MSFTSSSLSSMREFSLSPSSSWNLLLLAQVIGPSMLSLLKSNSPSLDSPLSHSTLQVYNYSNGYVSVVNIQTWPLWLGSKIGLKIHQIHLHKNNQSHKSTHCRHQRYRNCHRKCVKNHQQWMKGSQVNHIKNIVQQSHQRVFHQPQG